VPLPEEVQEPPADVAPADPPPVNIAVADNPAVLAHHPPAVMAVANTASHPAAAPEEGMSELANNFDGAATSNGDDGGSTMMFHDSDASVEGESARQDSQPTGDYDNFEAPLPSTDPDPSLEGDDDSEDVADEGARITGKTQRVTRMK